MEQALNEIIINAPSIGQSIQLQKLRAYTRTVPASSLRWSHFSRLEHLYILGSEEYLPPDVGTRGAGPMCFVDKETSWMLVIGASADEISMFVERCGRRLKRLDIRFTQLRHLNVGHLTGLRDLKLMSNTRLQRIVFLEQLEDLQTLDLLRSYTCETLNVSRMSRLRELKLGYLQNLHHLTGVENLRELQILQLLEIPAEGCPALDALDELEELILWNTGIRGLELEKDLPKLNWLSIRSASIEDADFLCCMPGLKKLELLECGMKQLPDLSRCAGLHTVNLNGSPVQTIEGLPESVRELRMARCGLQRVPDCIQGLKHLESLDLSEMTLETLPVWLKDLNLPIHTEWSRDVKQGILLFNTQVPGVNLASLSATGNAGIFLEGLARYQAEDADDSRKMPGEVRVVFFGDAEADRRLIIRRLVQGGQMLPAGETVDDPTPEIGVSECMLKLDEGTDIRLRIWDFGGKRILHAMHRSFKNQQTLYVVVLNGGHDIQDQRVSDWLRYIHHELGQARVLLVLNGPNRGRRTSINETKLRRQYPQLPPIVRISAAEDDMDAFDGGLMEAIRAQLRQFHAVQDLFDPRWRTVRRILEKDPRSVIYTDVFEEICDEAGVEAADDHRNALRAALANLGTILENDSKTIMVKPEWAINAICMILYNPHLHSDKGRVSQEEIKNCLKDSGGKRPNVPLILDLMNQNGLACRMPDGTVFIPMLCQQDESDLVREYYEDPNSVEVRWEFPHLPENLLFQLMLERDLAHELDHEHVWYTGARFLERDVVNKKKEIVNSAMVWIEDNTLTICARGMDFSRFAGEYLIKLEGYIKNLVWKWCREVDPAYLPPDEQIDPVNREADVFAGIRRWLVFKVGPEREYFDYHRVLSSESAHVQLCSEILGMPIRAEDVRDQVYNNKDCSKQALLVRDIIKACSLVQSDQTFCRGHAGYKENTRNKAVLRILDQKNYNVHEQTLRGVGKGGRGDGEIDLEFRKDPTTLWSVYEALNVSGFKETNWNEHFDRLMDNYNPNGLRFMFLTTYVDCQIEKFGGICRKFADHIREFSPRTYRVLPNTFMPLHRDYLEETQNIQAFECTYMQNQTNGDLPASDQTIGCRTKIYHLFVHFKRIGAAAAGENN